MKYKSKYQVQKLSTNFIFTGIWFISHQTTKCKTKYQAHSKYQVQKQVPSIKVSTKYKSKYQV